MAESKMKSATVDGVDLAYEVRGTGEPIVLIHGGILADAFAPLMTEPALADRYQLVRYHRRGYGQSARAVGPASPPEQATDCLGLIRHLGIERAHLAGYSIGGAIALQLARDAPAAVHALALLEPTLPAAITDPAALEYFLDTIGRALGQYGTGDNAVAVDTWAAGAFGPGYRFALERALPGAYEQAVTDADALFRIDAPALQQWSFSAEDAARLAQPVLSIWHDEPAWAGFRQTRELLEAWFPRLERFVLPDATHLLQVTRPRPVAEALANFFTRHPLSTRTEEEAP